MKAGLYFSLSLAVGLLFFSSCHKDEIPAGSIILYSFGFEDSLGSSFEGWTSSSYTLVNDVPPTGGTWSLQLEPSMPPGEGLAEKTVNLISAGTYNVQLSADTKVTNTGTGWLRLLLKHNGGSADTLATKSFTNTGWQNNSLTASANVGAGDQLVIQLSAGTAEIANWSALFDNIQLEKL
jgi:hypothetical protein